MAGWNETLGGRLAAVTVVCMAALLYGCGNTMQGAADPLSGDGSRRAARVQSLDEAIAETGSLAVPAGVDPALFGELQAELARVLQAQGVERFVSTAPQSNGSAVNDLMIVNNPDGSADLSWTYRNQGDGDLNSEVNIADLTPIGIHLGRNSASPTWNKARNTDNDRNEEVNISDITPIGVNLLNTVQGYWLQRAVSEDSTWNPVSQIEFSTSTIDSDSAQRIFSFHISVPVDGNFYRVAPYEGGDTGIPSNAVQAASFVLPGRPGNVSATQGTLLAAVDLSWGGVADVEFYEIQRREGQLGSFEHLADTADNGTVYTDTDVVSGTHYTYIVRGWQGEKKTDYSIQFEGWPMEPPLTPAGLTASDGDFSTHVSVGWGMVAGADEYIVYYSPDENGTFTELTRTTELSYDDTLAAPLELNWYYVTASNAAGESLASNKDSGYEEGALPVVESVAPLGSLSGDTVQMNALTSGAVPLSYDWQFGLAATPSTSTEATPMITMGEPGVYDCSLTVQGSFDSDVFSFQLTVTSDEWAHTLGTAAADEAYSVDADSAGNVYVIARAGQPLVAKFSPSGVLQWARTYTTDQDTQWISGAVSPSGEVLMSMALDDASETQGRGVCNVKIDTDGNLIFARVFSLGDTLILSRYPRTAFDDSGNMYVCYTSNSLITLDGLLVAYKMLPNGNIIWKGIYDTPSDYGHDHSVADGIAVDSAGNLYIGADEANVTKLATASGDVLWCRGWGNQSGTPHEHAYTMGVDSADNVYLGGGCDQLGDYQPFLIKFDQSGTILWQKAFASGGSTTSGQIVQMTVDQDGNVFALNPQRGDPGEPSRFYVLDASGGLLGAYEYTVAGESKIFSMSYHDGRVQFGGQAPDPDGVWTGFNDSLADYAQVLEDRTVTENPEAGAMTDDLTGVLSEYTAELDGEEGLTDVLIINLHTDNLN